ncbi:hypothetical protein MNBD_BACTEROID03-150 [hydrothermal vent metagenome]|uniref:Uncharacterized protein n=1 Tax=hydrothermal vent metagenome TaxID=652676 RepID=A0A3B0SXC2_9ZZZZ
MKTLVRTIENAPLCKIIFTDFFDTLTHRTVHPHYAIKLWGKFLRRELGLNISPNELFAIRIDSLTYLSKKHKTRGIELPYELLTKEIYLRLLNVDILRDTPFDTFKRIFEHADYISEISVQFKNEKVIEGLVQFKEKGYRIYLVSDFFLPKRIIAKILEFHEISQLFEDVFISCSIGKSKESGSLYPYILETIGSKAEETIMIGDNMRSDILNAAKYGIQGIHTRHLRHKLRNRRNLFGNDAHDFKKTCSKVESRCAKSNYPLSEYIIHFYFFTERLYIKAHKDGVKNLFFLSREGLFLKRIFDIYQDLNQFTSENKIHTHYFKASRQSAQKITLRPLCDEDFKKIDGVNAEMSLKLLLTWFLFSEDVKTRIIDELEVNSNEIIPDFFNSEVMLKLRENKLFIEEYEAHRKNQQHAFLSYIKSFDVNIKEEGIALVDVGWGGTMQECIYHFLKKEVPVTGYYIGLKEIYDIEPNTKRYGLNFSIYPSHGISDDILKANGQLYEQLLGAPHGSTLGYSIVDGSPQTIEFHEENEKYVFDKLIKDVQEYMVLEFEILFLVLRPINYSHTMAQEYMTNMALRNGIFTSKKKIKFINDLSKGFYQNVGENKVGLAYSPNQLRSSKFSLFKQFLRSPEKVFRLIVKIKPYLYVKGLYWLSWHVNMAYYYMKFNFWVKKKWFPKSLLKS